MEIQRTISAALTGTTVMTLLSYTVAEFAKKQFREPQVLGQLISRAGIARPKIARPAGWLIHYLVGFAFCTAYNPLWKKQGNPHVGSTVAMGLASGCIGVAAWNTVLKVHPNPPPIDVRKYYGHLIVAHVVFALAAAAGYRIISSGHKMASGRGNNSIARYLSKDKSLVESN